MKAFRTFLKLLLLLAVGGSIFGFIKGKSLPPASEITQLLELDPIQTAVNEEKFVIEKEGQKAEIFPRYDYEIYGLVVEDYDSEAWHDVTHKQDPFNTKDICLIWGKNTKNGLYQALDFSHGEFTCYYETDNWEAYREFNIEQFSNTHFLPANDEVYKTIKEVEIGDQVHISGKLVDYRIVMPGFENGYRRSSIVRNDTGNGACEVMYVNDFKILKNGNAYADFVYKASKYLIVFCLVALTVIFFMDIYHRPQSRLLSK